MIKNIHIRADGNSEIGLGHLIRSLALANMIKDEFEITFICKYIPESIGRDIIASGFSVNIVAIEEEWLELLSDNDIVVLDHYGLGTDFQKKIKEKVNFLVCIDDIPKNEFYADLIINHAPGWLPQDYRAQDYTQFALGLDYVLLRPMFLQAAKEQLISVRPDHLFICFGGSDFHNLTTKVLEIAMGIKEFKKISVVLGHAFNAVDEVKNLAANDGRIEVLCELDEMDMAELMRKADVAVVPSSGILLEALATGCLVISGKYALNQAHVYKIYKNGNMFIDAKNFEKPDVKTAFEKIKDSTFNAKVIDGKSAERVQKLFNSLLYEQQLSLREATIDDIEITYSWASNQELRQHSFTNKAITYDEHAEWFSRKLADLNCLYLIAEENGVPIGSLRYDISAGAALISYLVDPIFQGRGMGMPLLKSGFQLLKTKREDVFVVEGYVMPQNVASQKSFRRLGYHEEYLEEDEKFKYTKKI